MIWIFGKTHLKTENLFVKHFRILGMEIFYRLKQHSLFPDGRNFMLVPELFLIL